MKNLVFVLSVSLAVSALAADPVVKADSVSVSRYETNAVKIAYTLTGAPAIVTVSLETNTLAGAAGTWVKIPDADVGPILGAANRYVGTVGNETAAYWFPDAKFAGVPIDSLRATVSAWPTNQPPDYMVVDLSGRRVVKFYVSADALPAGVKNPEYRRSKLVMRKIPAKDVVWLMGSPNKLTDSKNPTYQDFAHKIRLKSDYYMGVFELTQGQLEALGQTNNSKFSSGENHEDLPAERLGWSSIGNMLTALRGISGITSFNLPTEAQWEYASHAGAPGQLYNNLAWTEDNLKTIAWYKGNATQTMPVGLKIANGFGLYDMLGNVWEMTRDAQGNGTQLAAYQNTLVSDWATGGITDDPQGAPEVTPMRKMKRGGSWYEIYQEPPYIWYHRTNSRYDTAANWDEGPSGTIGYMGCRVCCSVGDVIVSAE